MYSYPLRRESPAATFEDLRRGIPSEGSASFLTDRGLGWADCGCGCSEAPGGCSSPSDPATREQQRTARLDSADVSPAPYSGLRPWRATASLDVGAPSALADALRTRLAAARVSAASGGTQDEQEAAAQNEAISALIDEYDLRPPADLSVSRSTDFHFDCPPSPDSSCPVADVATCTGPAVGERSTICSDTALEGSAHIRVLNLDTFRSELGQTMRDLLKAAWCMIIENADAGMWATQLVQGPDRAAYQAWCIANRRLDMYLIDEVVPEINVFFTIPGSVLSGPMVMVGNTSSEIIHNWAAQWEHGDSAARQCVAVDVAALLFHETTHACGIYPIDMNPTGTCRDSYLIGNNFRLALLQRYPGAMDSLCCRHAYSTTNAMADNRQLDVNLLFMSNSALVLDPTDCQTASTSTDASSSEDHDAYLDCLKHPDECGAENSSAITQHSPLGR